MCVRQLFFQFGIFAINHLDVFILRILNKIVFILSVIVQCVKKMPKRGQKRIFQIALGS